ncbi:MAG: phage baseplate assembly protein [Sulfuriferula sp.]
MVEIKFNGERYGFWQSVSIKESVDNLCATISLRVQLPIEAAGMKLKLDANTKIEVLIDGELVTTFRAGKDRRVVGNAEHSISLEARSLARELVDCQYSITLASLKLAEVAQRICTVFELPLTVKADTAVVPAFSMQCEVPANALINAARVANLLLYPQPNGGLILTAPDNSDAVATLVYGDHIKRYELINDYDLRFSDYVVKSFDYKSGHATKGSIKDDGIKFFRPMHIVADRHGHSIGGCSLRAEQERNRRLAKAHPLNLTVQGHRHANGLWALNTRVRVVIPMEGIDAVYLIASREFSLDDKSGSVTQLQLMHRDAFVGDPPKKIKRSAGARGGAVIKSPAVAAPGHELDWLRK